MRVTVLTPECAGRPGAPVDVRIEVSNSLEVVDLISVEVPGIDAALTQVLPGSVSLFPGEVAVFDITIRVPRTLPAGDNVVAIDLVSSVRPDQNERCTFLLDVEPLVAGALKVRPQAVKAGKKGYVHAWLSNTGNVPLDVTMLAKDDERHLRFILSPPAMVVEPGTTAEVVVEAKGSRPFFGIPAFRNVYISADSQAGLLNDTVSFVQRPLFPRGLLTTALLATIVALWAGIFTYAIDRAIDRERSSKDVPDDFATPFSFASLADGGDGGGGTAGSGDGAGRPGESPAEAAARKEKAETARARLASSVSGTVVGRASGTGQPRIAVEAHRARRNATLGSDETRAQVTTTDENGDFTMSGLFPGNYAFLLVAPGYESVWYPAPPTGTDRVELVARDDVTVGDIGIDGEPGLIRGTIDTGGLDVPITVTLRPFVDEIPLAPVQSVPQPVSDQRTADGLVQYEFPGIASPLQYHLTFSSDRFADQVIIESLGAGEELQAAPVRLVPAPGSITGDITFIEGTPTEGVKITAVSGDTRFTVSTPRAGQLAGSDAATVTYELAGLTSPATYRLTFESPGFETVSRSVDLEAGEAGANADVVMNGGTRSLEGRIVGRASGLRIGDVTVEDAGPTITRSVTSLPAPTSPGPTSQSPASCNTPPPVAAYEPDSDAGTFRLENLELGVHALTFARPGWTTVTHRIEVTATGPPRLLDGGTDADGTFLVQLDSTVGEVCGTILQADEDEGISIGEVRLERSAGGLGDDTEGDQTFPISTDPAGAYKFTSLTTGDYAITIVAEGYVECTVLLRIGASDRRSRFRELDIRLSRDADTPCTIVTDSAQ